MSEHEREEEPNRGERQAINTGTGVALGAALGTVIFAFTEDPIWIALGAGLGAAFGAAFGAMKS